MYQHSTDTERMTEGRTVGLDVGDRYTHLCVLDAAGEVAEEGRVRTTPEGMRQRFSAMPRARVVLETGTHSLWLSALVTDCGHEVVVANARRLRLIAEHDGKSDRTDAETLARLGRVDPALLAPIRHRARDASGSGGGAGARCGGAGSDAVGESRPRGGEGGRGARAGVVDAGVRAAGAASGARGAGAGVRPGVRGPRGSQSRDRCL